MAACSSSSSAGETRLTLFNGLVNVATRKCHTITATRNLPESVRHFFAEISGIDTSEAKKQFYGQVSTLHAEIFDKDSDEYKQLERLRSALVKSVSDGKTSATVKKAWVQSSEEFFQESGFVLAQFFMNSCTDVSFNHYSKTSSREWSAPFATPLIEAKKQFEVTRKSLLSTISQYKKMVRLTYHSPSAPASSAGEVIISLRQDIKRLKEQLKEQETLLKITETEIPVLAFFEHFQKTHPEMSDVTTKLIEITKKGFARKKEMAKLPHPKTQTQLKRNEEELKAFFTTMESLMSTLTSDQKEKFEHAKLDFGKTLSKQLQFEDYRIELDPRIHNPFTNPTFDMTELREKIWTDTASLKENPRAQYLFSQIQKAFAMRLSEIKTSASEVPKNVTVSFTLPHIDRILFQTPFITALRLQGFTVDIDMKDDENKFPFGKFDDQDDENIDLDVKYTIGLERKRIPGLVEPMTIPFNPHHDTIDGLPISRITGINRDALLKMKRECAIKPTLTPEEKVVWNEFLNKLTKSLLKGECFVPSYSKNILINKIISKIPSFSMDGCGFTFSIVPEDDTCTDLINVPELRNILMKSLEQLKTDKTAQKVFALINQQLKEYSSGKVFENSLCWGTLELSDDERKHLFSDRRFQMLLELQGIVLGSREWVLTKEKVIKIYPDVSVQ